jgi:hypothetical protein
VPRLLPHARRDRRLGRVQRRRARGADGGATRPPWADQPGEAGPAIKVRCLSCPIRHRPTPALPPTRGRRGGPDPGLRPSLLRRHLAQRAGAGAGLEENVPAKSERARRRRMGPASRLDVTVAREAIRVRGLGHGSRSILGAPPRLFVIAEAAPVRRARLTRLAGRTIRPDGEQNPGRRNCEERILQFTHSLLSSTNIGPNVREFA